MEFACIIYVQFIRLLEIIDDVLYHVWDLSICRYLDEIPESCFSHNFSRNMRRKKKTAQCLKKNLQMIFIFILPAGRLVIHQERLWISFSSYYHIEITATLKLPIPDLNSASYDAGCVKFVTKRNASFLGCHSFEWNELLPRMFLCVQKVCMCLWSIAHRSVPPRIIFEMYTLRCILFFQYVCSVFSLTLQCLVIKLNHL